MKLAETTIAILLLGSSSVLAQNVTSETKMMQGSWGVSAEECRDEEGPNHNMTIEWPWVQRYEHICKRTAAKRDGKSIVFEVSCQYEGEKHTSGAMRVTLIAPDTLAAEFVQGASARSGKEQRVYQRCSRP